AFHPAKERPSMRQLASVQLTTRTDLSASSMPTAAAGMLDALKSVRVVSCTEASWRMLGLSFAGWNAVASAGLAVLALLAAILLKWRGNDGTVRA
ncbi:disulfide bond formation protein B, partial [Rhodobacterales bacterium]